MGTVSAKDLRASLEKARNLGLVEESFEILGHSLVVRNLRPNEIEAVIESCKGLEDMAYFNTYQREHVVRALCEIDGYDLREVDFIDDEEPDPKNRGNMRKVRVERHKWLSDNFLASWGPDAVLVAYQKIGDCSTRAGKESKDGIVFLEPDETPEQKYRRILGDLKAVEEDMPGQLLDRTLEEFGLVRRSTLNELKAADERLNKIRQAEIEAERAARQEEEAPPPPVEAPKPAVVSAQDIMARRQPLNQGVVTPPPPPPSPPASPEGVPSRSAQLHALEMDADDLGVLSAGPLGPKPSDAFRLTETATLGGPPPGQKDPESQAAAARTIIDPPVRGGINPKFRPPPKS